MNTPVPPPKNKLFNFTNVPPPGYDTDYKNWYLVVHPAQPDAVGVNRLDLGAVDETRRRGTASACWGIGLGQYITMNAAGACYYWTELTPALAAMFAPLPALAVDPAISQELRELKERNNRLLALLARSRLKASELVALLK